MGVLEKEGEDTNKIVIEVAKLLQGEIIDEQISTSHRLPVRPKRSASEIQTPPPIIARFVSRDVRNMIYEKRKLMKQLHLKNFSVNGTTRIFVNENLTQRRKALFWKVKQKSKRSGYKIFWTINGNVMVRKNENSDIISVKSEIDLSLIE